MLTADTHVHIYTVYNIAAFFDAALENLRHAAADSHFALFLTERRDCDVFDELADGSIRPEGFDVEKTNDPGALLLTKQQTNQRIILFAGRQYVSKEGIEVLSLASGKKVDESLTALEIIRGVRETGGIPVLSWAPGKWTGKRGGIVRAIIETHDDEPLLLGDTSMRPAGFPEPSLYKTARQKGIPIACGTDPLPFASDASIAGSFGIQSEVFDENSPVSSAQALLTQGAFTSYGRRSLLLVSIRRWLSNRASKRS